MFDAKQRVIENCLFGADINPNSVNICRLRLWIELLKNTFYNTNEKGHIVLQTLPNIDINIKTGNSLLNRFEITDNYTTLTTTEVHKINLATKNYKAKLLAYKNTSDTKTKRAIKADMEALKAEFATVTRSKDTNIQQLKEMDAKNF